MSDHSTDNADVGVHTCENCSELDFEAQRLAHELDKCSHIVNALIQGALDHACLLSVNGELLQLNEPAAEFLSAHPEEVIGKSVFNFSSPAVAHERRKRFKEALENAAAVRFEDQDGGRVFLHVFQPVFFDGRIESMAWFARDLTEAKRSLSIGIQDARLRAIAELAAGISHNFNNLLQVALGGAQLALGEIESGDIKHAKVWLKQVVESSQSGTETVRRLQEFAQFKPEQNRDEIFDLSALVHQAIAMTHPLWKSGPQRHGVSVRIEYNPEGACIVKGCSAELFEVTVTLIKNAVEALTDGGVITIRAIQEGGKVLLQVADEGEGIAHEHLDKILAPFFSTKNRPGMGLASAAAIVGRHGGEIDVQSRLGSGTSVTVSLPAGTWSLPKAKSTDDTGGMEKLEILVVDDLEPVVRQLDKAFTRLGHHVKTALSGPDALELFKENPVDVIICDLGMPDMNGWQVGKAVRESCAETGRPQPIFLILTGWGGQVEETEKITESAVDGVIEKPADIRQIIEIVKEARLKRGH